jgi:hypothetical protein
MKVIPCTASKHPLSAGVGEMKLGAAAQGLFESKISTRNCRGMLLSGVVEDEEAKSSICIATP